MRRLIQRLYYYYFYTVFIFWFLLGFPVAYFLLRRPGHHRRAHALRKKWARLVLFSAGIRYRVLGEDISLMTGTYVYTANHTSPIDILAILAVFPGYFAFMAKEEMLHIPLFGMFFRTIDLAVDRSSRIKSAISYKQSVEALKSGKGLVIFPEGGILGKLPLLQPFKDGAFDLAIRQKIPVLPFTFPDNWKHLPDDESKIGKPGKIRIILHRPINTSALTKDDVQGLKQQVFDIIAKDMEEYH